MNKINKKLQKENEELRMKLEILKKVIDDTFYMAIRYAHGRHTFAPTIIRDSLRELKKVFPNFQLRHDDTIKPPTEDELKQHIAVRDDWLDDLFKKKVEKEHY